jgi:multiple sugar transport system permease protein
MSESASAMAARKTPVSASRGKRKLKLGHLAFVLPAVLLNLVFFVYPLVQAFVMSFYDWPVLGRRTFVGLKNYSDLLQDQRYWDAMWFTFKYTLVVTPAILVVAFVLAMLINNRLPGTVVFRSVYFLPVVISLVTASLLWLWIYNDLYGILNYYLLQLGVIDKPVFWMGQASTSLPAVSLMITWKAAGFTMIILLAGLQSIPDEVYEAARIDGADRWQLIRHITIPLLTPSIALAMIISVIGSVLAFEQFLIMTRGGPSNSTTTVVQWIYNTSFKYFELGYGAAMTFVVLALLVLLSLVQLRILRSRAEY